MRQNLQRPRRQLPEGKAIRFSHSPFTLDIDNETKISCNSDGELTITQGNIEKDDYDEIKLPASAFYKAIDMLALTRKTTLVDKADIPRRKVVGSEE